MKKIILLAACILSGTMPAQENKTLRFGLSFGINSNHSQFTGGMPGANARFNQNPFGTGALDFIGRYDHDKHWMASFGMGIGSTGYEFTISENYSLLNKSKQFSSVKSDIGKLELPAMLFYKFNPNCKNVKWLVGGGFVPTFIVSGNVTNNFDDTKEGNANADYLTATVASKSGTHMLFRWSVAREKMFKNGSLLNAVLIFNIGFNQITRATVKYTIDNQNYEHHFSSNGNFVGLRVSYFFRPSTSFAKT